MKYEDHRRGNLIQFLPLRKSDRVLLVGRDSACLEEALKPLVAEVITSEFSLEFIAGQMPVQCDPGQTAQWSVIMFCNAGDFLNQLPATEWAERITGMLEPDGMAVIATDNPLGMKYLAGHRNREEDVFFPFFTTDVEAVEPVLRSLDREFTARGQGVSWYYPYPDITAPVAVYSDQYLPGPGECDENLFNFQASRLVLFDESAAFDKVVKAGLFPQFANGYLVVMGRREYPQVIFSRYSAERTEHLKIRTDILRQESGSRSVRKVAAVPAARGHIASLDRWYKELSEQMEGFPMEPNRPTGITDDSVGFEFIKGEPLDRILDRYLHAGDIQNWEASMREFMDRILALKGQQEFLMTAAFTRVFGQVDSASLQWEDGRIMTTLPVTDIDMIFRNVLREPDGTLQVIDYEWTFDFPIPVAYVLYRCLYFYLEERDRRKAPGFPAQRDWYQEFGIHPAMKEQFEAMETSFQKYVQQGAVLMRDSYAKEGKPAIPLSLLTERMDHLLGDRIRVCQDFGSGFAEENSYYLETRPDQDGIQSFVLDFTGEPPRSVRLETGTDKMLLRVGLLQEDEHGSAAIPFFTNGMELTPVTFLFDTTEPHVLVPDIGRHVTRLYVSLQREFLHPLIMEDAVAGIKRLNSTLQDRDRMIAQFLDSTSWKITKPLRKLRGNKE